MLNTWVEIININVNKNITKFTWIFSVQGKKSKVLQKFITKTHNLVFCHYSGVLNTWVEIININVNKFDIKKSL